MKMTPRRYDMLHAAIAAHVTARGADLLRAAAASVGGDATMWYLFSLADRDLQYPDTHPHFVSGRWTRRADHVPGYRAYDDNGTTLCDSHILTALRRIGADLGLL